jgi:hypothetical protein
MKLKSAISIGTICFLLAFSFLHSQPLPVYADAGSLELLSDTINSQILNLPEVKHTISFTLPVEAQVVSPTDWIHIDLSNFGNVTAPNFVGGQFGGTPSFSVSGKVAKVTGISIVPGHGISIQGITATNPASEDNFGLVVKITQDEAGEIIKNIGFTFAAAHVGSISVTANVGNPSARIMISGHTAPQTQVFFSKGGPLMGTTFAGADGYYSKLFTGLEPGSHNISVHGLDTSLLTTSIINLEIYAPVYQTTNIYNLLLSPTLKIHNNTILQGETLIASGSAYPNSDITLFTDSPVRSYSATTSATGVWTQSITNTADYNVGDYRIYAMAQRSNGIQSMFSPSLIFTIASSTSGGGAACGDISQGDLNCDGLVDLTDFSILMYYWGTTNLTADINSDGLVDLTDFSIMMYYWGA